MKELKNFAWIFLTILVITFITGNAFASYFTEGWETSKGWTGDANFQIYASGGNPPVLIQDTIKYAGTYSLLNDKNGSNYAYLDANIVHNNDYNYSGWAYYTNASAQADISVGNGLASANSINTMLYSGNAYRNVCNGSNTSIYSSISTNTWYQLIIQYHSATQTADFYVKNTSGTTLGNANGIDVSCMGGSPTNLHLISGAGDYAVYFDNITANWLSSYATGITTNFDYTVNPSDTNIEFVDTTTDNNADAHVVLNDWNWFVDTVMSSTDQNYTLTGITENTDYNIALHACGDYGGSTYCSYKERTVSSGRWFGDTNFFFYDEVTGIATSATLDFNGTQYTGTSFQLPSRQITNESETNVTRTFTITKTDYGTRYYTVDMNKYTDLNIGFAMLPNTSGRSIEFQVYQTDEETLYTNTYIELLLNDQEYRVSGRRKTSSAGNITFFVNPNDANYTMRIYGSTIQDYNSMALTVNHPKDETTGTQIDANWYLTVTGLAWQSYSDINGSQTVQIYANTVKDYGLTIGDELSEYYARKYYVNYLGGTTAAILQPYLVDVNNAVSTTIYTISGYTQQPVGSILIKIYKTVPVDGRVLVEQVTTDAEGEALLSMIANAEYEFEVYDSGVLVGNKIYFVTSTSTKIYISLDDLGITTPTIDSGFVDVRFNPQRGRLIGTDTTLDQTITIQDTNLGITFTNAYIWITNTDVNGINNNDVNIWTKTITTQSNSITIDHTNQTLDGNYYDGNGFLIVNVLVTTNQGTYYEKYVYKPVIGFDFYKALGFDLRTTFSCTATSDPLIPCGSMLFIAIIISILATVGFVLESGMTSQEGAVAVFLGIMGVFTYFAWVPAGLYIILVVSVIMLMIAIGGRLRV